MHNALGKRKRNKKNAKLLICQEWSNGDEVSYVNESSSVLDT